MSQDSFDRNNRTRLSKTPEHNTAPACLIDASIYIFRYYFALPDNWYSRDQGYGTGAVYGYTTFLLRLLEQARPSHMAACYDESLGQGVRHQLYPGYKASRALPDEALAFQLAACREASELLGIASFASQTHEADDLIGTLAQILANSPMPVAIVTRDKDLGQLLRRSQDYLWDPAGDTRTNAQALEARLGIKPEQLADYLSLVGDAIDDIPGVPGVGAKTAQALLQRFGSVEQMLHMPEQIAELPLRGARTLADKLLAHREQIALARQLTTIECSLPLGVKVADLSPRPVDWVRLADFFERMGFGSDLLTRTRQVLTVTL